MEDAKDHGFIFTPLKHRPIDLSHLMGRDGVWEVTVVGWWMPIRMQISPMTLGQRRKGDGKVLNI